jgi:starvation-inducible DNA-binding protein
MKTNKNNDARFNETFLQPALHQQSHEIQNFDSVIKEVPLGLSATTRQTVVKQLNQVLADTMSLRDLYKKSHWQVSGPTFYQLHLLFDKHYNEQTELIDLLAERIQTLGGISVAMSPDVAEMTVIERPPAGREEPPAQISRLLEAHETILKEVHATAKTAGNLGDDGTNDLLISNVLRTNELQAWFLYEHLVNIPLVIAE